ncbi:MAG: chemotaxis protein CheX [Agathobacter sp.]|nr:chemotaxis protein CheX [Agathobacter sp.]
MYTQFFGNYLLSNGYVTKEQLFSAMQREATQHMKLGTLAMHAGYMNASQVDETVIQQTHQDRKFGELAVELGYLTDDQVLSLLKQQNPAYLSLGQVLLDDGILTNSDFEIIMNDYSSKNGIQGLDAITEMPEAIHNLLNSFFQKSDTSVSHNGYMFVELLFNDFLRFIGDDFTPMNVKEVKGAPINCCVKQEVHGDYSINTYISMDQPTAIAFASRYVHEQFSEYDEYVQASLEDFLNLQNGLFIVNVSNDSSTELTLGVPEHVDTTELSFEKKTLQFEILYPFGTIYFYMELIKSNE